MPALSGARGCRLGASFVLAVVIALMATPQWASAQYLQQGPKLVGTGATGTIDEQGLSVALSSDGNTAIVGGPGDNRNTAAEASVGAAWIFIRNNGVWSQQGYKLIGTGADGFAVQGVSVAISADGNTAIVGGPNDALTTNSSGVGAAWVFTRSAGIWSQQGPKLVGSLGVAGPQQGFSVALSDDGNTAIVGGPFDNQTDGGAVGAAWVFTRSGGTSTQQGDKLVPGSATTDWQIAGTGDFDGDGKTDILWRQTTTGKVLIWKMNGVQPPKFLNAGSATTDWQIAGTGDFDGDGKADILWRNGNGQIAVWLMDGAQTKSTKTVGTATSDWQIQPE
jgi:FG-GAP-like repeat